ncbi:MAG: IPT/TIG domain-containing protein, partial [bacterium]
MTITGTNFGTSQGTSTVTFNGVASQPTSWNATSIISPVPSGVAPGTATVVVTVNGTPSNGMNFTVTSAGAGIALVQHASKDAGTSASSALAFNTSNTGGNFIAVVVRAGALNEGIAVTDSIGNAYQTAVQFNQTADGFTFGIYYAQSIKGGANTVIVSGTISATLRFAILEYSGVATAGSLDAIASAQGHSAAPTTNAAVNTTASGDLLLGSAMTGNPGAFVAGSGYQIEESTPGEPGTKLMVEDQIQVVAGPASVSATLGSGADDWAAGMAAFKAAGGVAAPPPAISGLDPTSGPVGTIVTIGGTNFGATQGNSTAAFGGIAVTPSNWTSSSIVVAVPSGLAVGNAAVVVTVAGVASNSLNFAVSATGPAITQQPTNQQVFVGQSATFTATATGTAPLTYQWQETGVDIPGANSASYTTPPTSASDDGSVFQVNVSNSAGSLTSMPATLSVSAAPSGPNVLTQHYDNARSGQNITETILTPANVKSATFGKRFSQAVDGQLYAQPLYVSNLSIPGKGTHNVVFVATEADSVYAFDADNNSGANATWLWKASLIDMAHGAASGAVPMQSTDINCTDMEPQTGITSTPVINLI